MRATSYNIRSAAFWQPVEFLKSRIGGDLLDAA
jgi:hypothetical protein